jgi:predicted Ser/Thr protein kinase
MTKCPKCSKEFSENTAGGLCPACLLQQGLESQAGVTARPETATFPGPHLDQDVNQPMSPEQLMALLPQFDQIEFIGRGGMGVVYKARQKNLDRPVALKVLLPEVAGSPGFAGRFAREARAMARLNHPNIVAVHDFGCVDNSGVELCYFSMEFVDGSNLRGLIKQLTPSQALAIVPQICEALQYAHDIGIIHRDIKPENILVDKKGRVKIADFGLAKLLQTARSPSDYTLTRPDLVMGTPSYMAPEQMERPAEVDHRADLYSLGVVFYEMLTGQLPKGRFLLPSQRMQIDVRFDEVVLKALQHDRELRYQNASEVQTSVEAVRSTPGPSAAPTPQERAIPPSFPPGSVAPIPMVEYAAAASPPRLSRMAIIAPLGGGIGLLGLAAVATAAIYMAKSGGSPNWATGEMAVLYAVTLVGGLVMTLLGAVAVAQIRRMPKKLYGLRLALFDALLFPLLLLDLAFGALGAYLFVAMSLQPDAAGQSTAPGVVVSVLALFVLDPLIYWWIWNKLRIRTSAELDHAAFGKVAAPDNSPRLSTTALRGALCGAAIMLAAPLAIIASQNIDPRYYFDKQTGIFHQGPNWAIVLMFVGWVLSGLSVAGMMLLGVVAGAQIRRTPEKLYGLRLALFDALLCPLLLLDLVIGVLGAYLFVPSSHAPRHLSLSTDVPPETGSVASTVLGVLIFGLVGVLLDPLIYWWVWKKLRIQRPQRDNYPLAKESLARATAPLIQASAIAPTTREPKRFYAKAFGFYVAAWAVFLLTWNLGWPGLILSVGLFAFITWRQARKLQTYRPEIMAARTLEAGWKKAFRAVAVPPAFTFAFLMILLGIGLDADQDVGPDIARMFPGGPALTDTTSGFLKAFQYYNPKGLSADLRDLSLRPAYASWPLGFMATGHHPPLPSTALFPEGGLLFRLDNQSVFYPSAIPPGFRLLPHFWIFTLGGLCVFIIGIAGMLWSKAHRFSGLSGMLPLKLAAALAVSYFVVTGISGILFSLAHYAHHGDPGLIATLGPDVMTYHHRTDDRLFPTLDRWAIDHGYEIAALQKCDLYDDHRLPGASTGVTYQAAVLWKPGLFDRVGLGWEGFYSRVPEILVQSAGAGSCTLVRVTTPLYVRVRAENEASTALQMDLCAALNQSLQTRQIGEDRP